METKAAWTQPTLNKLNLKDAQNNNFNAAANDGTLSYS